MSVREPPLLICYILVMEYNHKMLMAVHYRTDKLLNIDTRTFYILCVIKGNIKQYNILGTVILFCKVSDIFDVLNTCIFSFFGILFSLGKVIVYIFDFIAEDSLNNIRYETFSSGIIIVKYFF